MRWFRVLRRWLLWMYREKEPNLELSHDLHFVHRFILLSINQLFSSIDAYAMVFLLLMELTSSSHTSLAGNSALLGFTLGEAIITLFAYLARDWLRLKWIITGYFTLVLPYLYFLPESPYWLFSKKKYNQLEAYLRKIARRNGHADHEWYPLFLQLVRDPRLAILSTKHASRTSKEVIIHHLKRLSICAFIGFVTMLLYIKISYGLGAMGNGVSPYWNIIIGAVVEGIGYITASMLITTRLGRKYSLILFSSCTAVCVFIIPFLMKSYPFLTTVISQIGKLTISGGVSITWIYIPEIFPTSIRGVANGVFVFAGRLGAILAPIVDVALGEKYVKFTFFTYSAWTVMLVILVYFLPETRNRSFHTDEDEEANDTVRSTKDIDGDGRGISNDAMTPSTPRAPHTEKLDNFYTKFWSGLYVHFLLPELQRFFLWRFFNCHFLRLNISRFWCVL